MKSKRYTSWHHGFFLKVFRFFFGPIFRIYYQFRRKKISLKKGGPYLVLANHTAEFDIIFTDMLFDKPLYFVASEQLLNSGKGSWFLKFFFNPIPKSKSMADLAVVKRMVSVRNEGGNIAIFPEGNASMHGGPASIPPGMGRLIKFLGMPVIFLNIHGLYLSAPRWAYYRKFGPSTIVEKRRLIPEQYASLSAEELDQIVHEALDVNAYQSVFPFAHYRGKKCAEGLHKLLFTCPQCQGVLSTYSNDNVLSCHQCTLQATYDEQGYVHFHQKKHTLMTLDEENKKRFIDYVDEHTDFSMTYPGFVSVWKAGEKRRSAFQSCELKMSRNGVQLILRNETILYTAKELRSCAIQVRTKLILYVDPETTLLFRFPRVYSPYASLIYLQYIIAQGGNQDALPTHQRASTLFGI